jgi:hypothetical protein
VIFILKTYYQPAVLTASLQISCNTLLWQARQRRRFIDTGVRLPRRGCVMEATTTVMIALAEVVAVNCILYINYGNIKKGGRLEYRGDKTDRLNCRKG